MFIKLGKIFFLLLMLYLEWFKEAFFTIDILMYSLIVALTIVLIMDMKRNNNSKLIVLPSIVKAYFALALFSFVTGVFFVKNLDIFISYLLRLFVFSILSVECLYIIIREKSVRWLLNIFIICALLCSFQTIFFGISYRGAAVTTMGLNNNPNKLGIVLVIGTMAILYDKLAIDKKPIINMAILFSFIYAVMLAASRKCFVSIAVVSLVWLIDYFQTSFSFKISVKQFLSILLIVVTIVFAVPILLDKYNSTALFIRMSSFLNESDLNTRLQLYSDAIDMWINNPILGIGYGQFGISNSYSFFRETYYSHSTYAELLSCTGTIGFLIFFCPIMKKFYQSIVALLHGRKNEYVDKSVIYNLKMIIVFFGIELFLAAGQILIYELDHMLFLVFLFTETDKLRHIVYLKHRLPKESANYISCPNL